MVYAYISPQEHLMLSKPGLLSQAQLLQPRAITLIATRSLCMLALSTRATVSAFVVRVPQSRIMRETVSRHITTKSVADFRKEYSKEGLDERTLPGEPFNLFNRWLQEAIDSQVIEPNAMCLSTVSEQGQPSGRFVLLKGVDHDGFVWYTNYESRKAGDLSKHALASLTFWWGPLERSVRIEGKVERVAEEESQLYFWSRPRGSQMGAWASNQSRPLPDREALEAQYKAIQERFADESVRIPKPPFWGGFRLLPSRIEFWKGRESRLHDRLVYTLVDSQQWQIQRLQP